MWTQPDSTYGWQLSPTDTGGTRVVTPIHAGYDEKHWPLAILGTGVLELGDFVMLRAIMSEPSVATGKRLKPLTGQPR